MGDMMKEDQHGDKSGERNATLRELVDEIRDRPIWKAAALKRLAELEALAASRSHVAPSDPDAQAKALFEKNAAGYLNKTPWDELHEDTRQLWRDEDAKRTPSELEACRENLAYWKQLAESLGGVSAAARSSTVPMDERVRIANEIRRCVDEGHHKAHGTSTAQSTMTAGNAWWRTIADALSEGAPPSATLPTDIERAWQMLEVCGVPRDRARNNLARGIEVLSTRIDREEWFLKALEADAARWRALFGCRRIRVLGYARGGPQGKDGPIRHIGFEWTSDQAPYCDTELVDGKERLIEFTDALIKSVTPDGSGAGVKCDYPRCGKAENRCGVCDYKEKP